MKKILSFVLIITAMILVGCGNEKMNSESPVIPPTPTITRAEANAKLEKLATVLDVQFDDMKEVTFCRCPIDIDMRPSIWIIPYVAIDKNYNAILYQDILYVGNEPLYFDRLYIKTNSGVEKFQYENVIKSYAGEEYNGLMEDALYKRLQEAIKEGFAKFRLEGRTFGERELTEEELSDMEELFSIYEYFNSVKVEN